MRKIFYVPGLISALLIPVLFWYCVKSYNNRTVYNIVDIGLPAKLAKDKSNYDYTFESLRNWNYKKIKEDPSTAKENSAFYVSELKTLQKRNQKETGIEFILDENSSYGDFVSLLNDMAIAKYETYGLDINKTGHFFVPLFYKNPDAKNESSDNEMMIPIDAGSLSSGNYKPDLYERSNILFLNLPKQSYHIIFGFLLFLNISMFSIKENLQMRRHLI